MFQFVQRSIICRNDWFLLYNSENNETWNVVQCPISNVTGRFLCNYFIDVIWDIWDDIDCSTWTKTKRIFSCALSGFCYQSPDDVRNKCLEAQLNNNCGTRDLELIHSSDLELFERKKEETWHSLTSQEMSRF